jgi:hypothetical protein
MNVGWNPRSSSAVLTALQFQVPELAGDPLHVPGLHAQAMCG